MASLADLLPSVNPNCQIRPPDVPQDEPGASPTPNRTSDAIDALERFLGVPEELGPPFYDAVFERAIPDGPVILFSLEYSEPTVIGCFPSLCAAHDLAARANMALFAVKAVDNGSRRS